MPRARKQFAVLEEVLAGLPGADVRMESRPKRYKFGCLNYGEVCNDAWYNASDGDKFDVFAPGFNNVLTPGTYRCLNVLGVLKLKNGNDKIAVRLAGVPGYDDARASREILRYATQYTSKMRMDGVWEPID